MKGPCLKYISVILLVLIFSNLFILSFTGTVKAGLWDNNSGLLFVLKGLIMIWILNLMNRNSVDNDKDILSSTIEQGMDLYEGNNNTIVNEEYQENEDEINNDEQQMTQLVNNIRSEKGIQYLTIDKELVKIAREKAKDMLQNNYFAHESPESGSIFNVMEVREINYYLAGENLAEARTIESAFESLMNSPEHRDNILESRYNKIGVGVIEGGKYGLIIVQLFVYDASDLLN
jgi:hypothetical protein